MFDDDGISNPSRNPTFDEVCASRRKLSQGSAAGATLILAGMPLSGCSSLSGSSSTPAPITFKPVAVSTADRVTVSDGYIAEVIVPLGAPISAGPAWKPDASNSAAEQEQQVGDFRVARRRPAALSHAGHSPHRWWTHRLLILLVVPPAA